MVYGCAKCWVCNYQNFVKNLIDYLKVDIKHYSLKIMFVNFSFIPYSLAEINFYKNTIFHLSCKLKID